MILAVDIYGGGQVRTNEAGFSNSAVDRRFSTPVAAAVDGNLSKVVEKNV